MDSWILGLRADEDVQLEYRALLGPSIRTIGRVEVHAFEASSREAAARIFDSAAASLGYGTAAVACDEPSVHEDGAEVLPAIERVVALCMTAAPGEFTFTLQAAKALSTALCFARARRRPGWRLPFACASLAEVPRLRSACRESAAKLPERPAFVDRADELDAVLDALGDGTTAGFAVIRASGRMGSTRLVHEAAARVGARVIRRVYEGDAVVVSAIDEVLRDVPDAPPRWLLVEARDAQRLDVDVASITVGRAAVLAIVGPDCDTPWCPPLREVELGPLAPAESRSIVRSLLGDATEDMLVSRFARRSSVPGRLVELVRAAALSGEVIFDPISNTWHTRARRLVRLASQRERVTEFERRIASLDGRTRRAFEVALAMGDGASEHALRGVLRVVFGAVDLVRALQAHGLATMSGGTVDLGRGPHPAVDPELKGRIDALRTLGVLDALIDAERSLAEGAPDTASRFVRAARAALAAGDRGAAVRLLASTISLPRAFGDTSIETAMRAVAAELGPLATVTAVAGATAASSASPEALESAARAREATGDAPAAMRLRALAGLLKGDASLARRVGADGTSVRDHLLGALAHARESRVPAAVRSAVAALAQARRERDTSGEAATLAMLASLYHAVGRHDAAVRLSSAISNRGR